MIRETVFKNQMKFDDNPNMPVKKIGESKVKKKDCLFSLRLPKVTIDAIDEIRKKRIGKISRNQWILEAIAKGLK